MDAGVSGPGTDELSPRTSWGSGAEPGGGGRTAGASGSRDSCCTTAVGHAEPPGSDPRRHPRVTPASAEFGVPGCGRRWVRSRCRLSCGCARRADRSRSPRGSGRLTPPPLRALQSALSRDAPPDGWKLVLTRKQVPENGVLLRILTGRRRAQCRSAGIAGLPGSKRP
jgi:hypothetical protein